MTHSDSLFAKYLNERHSCETIWEDDGFISYRISGNECLLAEMYIEPHARSTKCFKVLIDRLTEISLAKSCSHLLAHIHINDKTHDRTLRSVLRIGFSVVQAHDGILTIKNKIKEDIL